MRLGEVKCTNRAFIPEFCEEKTWRQLQLLLLAIRTPSGELKGIILFKTPYGSGWVLMQKAQFHVRDFPVFPIGLDAHYELDLRACDTNFDQVNLVVTANLTVQDEGIRT